MLQYKYIFLIVFGAGLALGLLLPGLFSGREIATPAIAIVPPAVIKNEAIKNATIYKRKIDSLQANGKNLFAALQTTQTQLDKAKKKNLALQTQVYDLIDKQAEAKALADTATLVNNCDSLAIETAKLITAVNEKDSLYEADTSYLLELVHNRDSTIDIHASMYQSLQTSFDKSLEQLQQQLAQNKVLKKQVKRQRFKSTLRTIGIAIVTGLAAHYTSNH